jgi:hypothetical protein
VGLRDVPGGRAEPDALHPSGKADFPAFHPCHCKAGGSLVSWQARGRGKGLRPARVGETV